jgi:hypothetical protein
MRENGGLDKNNSDRGKNSSKIQVIFLRGCGRRVY